MKNLLLLLLVLPILLSQDANAIAFVQSTSGNVAGDVSLAIAFTSNLGGGGCSSPSPSLLIVAVRTGGNRNSTIAASDTKTSTWTKDLTDATNGTFHVFSAPNVASGADTVTISFTSSSSIKMAIHEYCGIVTSSALDQISTNGAGTSASRTSNATATTAQASELLFGAEIIASTGDTAWTPGSGYTTRETQNTSSTINLVTQDRIVAATGAYAADGTGTLTNSTWFMGIATYKGSSASPPSLSTILSSKRRR